MECFTGLRDGEHDFVGLAESFARKTVQPMFEGDFPDGDPARVASILSKAFEVGLASSPDSRMPGYEYGIWGANPGDSGNRLSAILLSVIARTCSGIAMNLHSQGLASSIITASQRKLAHPPGRVAAALQEGYGLPGYLTLIDPAREGPEAVSTMARAHGSGYVISGNKSFVYGMSGTEAFVVFCRVEDGGWGCFLVPADTPGVQVTGISERTGLRSCGLFELSLKDVEIPADARLDEGDAASLVKRSVCLHWLGLSAIAAGNGQGALLAAKRYASERYQGGTLIENHPAVRKLVARSEARVETAFALLLKAAESLEDAGDCLRQCAIAKLTITELGFQAVTDCLQVFGGYGYMEDYRMEKRLRDAVVLKSAGGSGNALELFIFEVGREV
ncbi:MAG TPA: acyl-CoA dehydrogenase [Deltaproteobacteria bacterium]|jgi:alkylation response protein AidB-like acyl-CoA dehydrogenase|nr:acyl-CoA dehydrogenase [Deltaproteobacteria bacterium]HOI07074.1 acyl-CoA dehydrogenase [Deltaproteobacteria bacterium]